MSDESKLKGPLEEHLEPVLDDARIQAIARGVQASRHVPAQRPVLRFALAGSLAIGAVAFALVFLRPADPKPMALADGAELPLTLNLRTQLSDGSEIDRDAASQLEVVANQPARLTLALRHGRARFEVNPKPHRQWLIEVGDVTVEVVGTVFTVDRADDGVHVTVERGTVVVRSDRLPDHVERVEAGQQTFVAALAAAVPAAVVDTGSEPDPIAAVVAAPSAPSVNTQAWLPLAHTGDFVGAWIEIDRVGFANVLAGLKRPDALLILSDTARSTAHPAEAAAALKRLLAVSPDDATAATAAFTLGRLELEKLDRPGAAADHFARVAAHPGLGLLAEDALTLRVYALQKTGELEKARSAARDAVARFPTGAHHAALQSWLDDPEHAAKWLH